MSAQLDRVRNPVQISGSDWIELRDGVHRDMLGLLNLRALQGIDRPLLKPQIYLPINQALKARGVTLEPAALERLADELLDELVGLGPLEPLMQDPEISDIVINGYKNVFVERRGKMEKADVGFFSDEHVIRVVNKIVSSAGRRIDEAQPMVDARLADGSRINAVIPPLALDGPLVSIRRFAVLQPSFDRLEALGALSSEMSELLRDYVRSRRNILISGGTGSGKTTLLNILATEIPQDHRVITIEDSAELRLHTPNVARLETRPANMEGQGKVSQRELLRNALRMRPDRIILGEVRGDETIDMLQAMNTGHDGSMTTIHANGPSAAITRIENLIILSGVNLSSENLERQIASTINVIVHVGRFEDGVRRLCSISELSISAGRKIILQPVFQFCVTDSADDGGVIGEFRRLSPDIPTLEHEPHHHISELKE